MIESLDILLSVLVLIGALFVLLGSVALVKLPDFFMRLHGPTKASTLGTGAILTGLIAGGVGAVIVAISTPTLRQAGNWEISALLGSLAGLGFWFFDTVTAQTLGMFIVWQVMVAVFFAHRLRASVSTGRRPG